MSDELLPILTAIHKDVGEIKGRLESHVEQFAQHVEDDKKAYRAVFELKQSHARQRGFLTALGVVASAVGSACGYLLHKLLSQ